MSSSIGLRLGYPDRTLICIIYRLFKIDLNTFTLVEFIDMPTRFMVTFLGAYGFSYFVDMANPCKCGQVDLSTFSLTTTISTGIDTIPGGCRVGVYDFETDYVYAV